eukprot:UN27678
MQTLSHPNIVRLYDVFESEKELCMVMELCSGKDLFYMMEEILKWQTKADNIMLYKEPGGKKVDLKPINRGITVDYVMQKGNWLQLCEPRIGWIQIKKHGVEQVAQKHLSEKDVSRMIKSITETIEYMHKNAGIVHRDIKPENILLKEPGIDSAIKITDFGLAGDLEKLQVTRGKSSGVGTLEYSAPEVLNGDRCGAKMDIWSLG